jgi:hypothetical protein
MMPRVTRVNEKWEEKSSIGSKEEAMKNPRRARVRLGALMWEKGTREHRQISVREIIRETKLPNQLVTRMSRDQLRDLPLYAIVPLMEYFELKDIGELFEITENPISPPVAKD